MSVTLIFMSLAILVSMTSRIYVWKSTRNRKRIYEHDKLVAGSRRWSIGFDLPWRRKVP